MSVSFNPIPDAKWSNEDKDTYIKRYTSQYKELSGESLKHTLIGTATGISIASITLIAVTAFAVLAGQFALGAGGIALTVSICAAMMVSGIALAIILGIWLGSKADEHHNNLAILDKSIKAEIGKKYPVVIDEPKKPIPEATKD